MLMLFTRKDGGFSMAMSVLPEGHFLLQKSLLVQPFRARLEKRAPRFFISPTFDPSGIEREMKVPQLNPWELGEN